MELLAVPLAVNDAYSVNEDTALDSNDSWFDSDWSFRRTLSFDNTAQTENLADVPVLVTLDATRIDYGQTQNNGEDLRFVDGDGTVLAHEIEEWNEGGTSYVWVKVQQVDGSSDTDFIHMYYGNAVAADGQNARTSGTRTTRQSGTWTKRRGHIPIRRPTALMRLPAEVSTSPPWAR